MRHLRYWGLIVIGLLFLAGCGPNVTAGTVAGKGHNTPYDVYIPGTDICSGSPPVCQIIPGYFVHYDESWRVTLRDDQGNNDFCTIPQALWKRVQVGDILDCEQVNG